MSNPVRTVWVDFVSVLRSPLSWVSCYVTRFLH